MKDFSYGLVLGKMCPPHNGHKFLIDTAAKRCDHVDVLITDTPVPGFNIPVEKRVEWVAEMFYGYGNVRVRSILDLNINDFQLYSHGYWADYVKAILGYTPEAIFTSETYGKPWADAVGAEHVLVDLDRHEYPVSGTAVRSNSIKTLDLLPHPVRDYYVPRIVLVGAESTGTTTLAKELSQHFGEPYVEEYGRTISERWAQELGRPVTDEEWRDKDKFRLIAHTQNALEDREARYARRMLVCDTDSFATMLWWRRYGANLDDFRELGKLGFERLHRPNRFYIITSTEGMPFVQDDYGTRADGNHRHRMQNDFYNSLLGERIPFIEVDGDREQRKYKAIKAVESWLDMAPLAVV